MFTFSQYKPDYFFLNFDTKKLNEWKKKQNININDSFYHIWNKRKKNITYIVLKGQEEKTLSLIDKIFKSRKTDIILLPDVSSDEGINPPINIEDLNDEEKNIFELIKKYSIPYIGYNKDERIFIDKALKKFTPQDILLFLFLSFYVFCYKDLRRDIKFFSQMIKDLMPEYEKYIEKKTKEKLEKISYNKLFLNYYGFKFNFGVTSIELVKPDKDSKYDIKKLSYLNMVENNKYTLRILFEKINQFNNIIILGKEKDYYIQKDVIIEEFGQGNTYV